MSGNENFPDSGVHRMLFAGADGGGIDQQEFRGRSFSHFSGHGHMSQFLKTALAFKTLLQHLAGGVHDLNQSGARLLRLRSVAAIVPGASAFFGAGG